MSKGISISCFQNAPDDFVRKPFSLQEARKPPAPGIPVKGLHGGKLSMGRFLRGFNFEFSRQNQGQCPANGLAVNAFVSQFLLDPAPAEPAQPYPSLYPLIGKLFIVKIAEPNQIGKDSADKRLSEFLILQLLLNLRVTSRAVRKIAVGGVLCPEQLFFF
jgi:hypothetical protein